MCCWYAYFFGGYLQVEPERRSPAAWLVLVLGAYRFISGDSALINAIGNGGAPIFIAHRERLGSQQRANARSGRGKPI